MNIVSINGITNKRMEKSSVHEKIRNRLKNSKTSIDSRIIVENLKNRNHLLNDNFARSIIYKLKQEYDNKYSPIINVSEISDDYNIIVNDESILNPFIISPGLVRIIRKHTDKYSRAVDKARAIYDWMETNIQYGKNNRKKGYKNTKEVLNDREGICGEMAFVYITMARVCGLKSAYVSVTVDCFGDKIHHACANVSIKQGDILVDPAYHTFDIHHLEYIVLSDYEVLERFNQWR